MSQVYDIDLMNPTVTSPATDVQRLIDGFSSLRSNFSGSVEPASADQVPFMFWADTTSGNLKIRNAANSAWVVIGTLASSGMGLLSASGGNLTGAVNFVASTVASSATPTIFDTTIGNVINYTGTATCTGFAAAPQAGAQRLLLCSSTASFTAGATMFINGQGSGVTYTCAAGDQVLVTAVSTTTFRLSILRGDGGNESQGVAATNSQVAPYTLVATDRGKTIWHPTSDNNARAFTIPANSSVPFPAGTLIHVVNEINTVTIPITTDTLVLSPGGTTGTRTIAASGVATLRKVSATRWYISGSGVT